MVGDDIVSVEVSPVTNTAADCNEIVLRSGELTRVLFRAKLVDAEQSEAGVNGSLVFQRKSKSENWDACEKIDLRTVKAGEAVEISLHSDEILALRNYLNDLQAIKQTYGVPGQSTRFIAIRKNSFTKLFGGNEVELIVPKNDAELIEAVSALLAHDDLSLVAKALRSTSAAALGSLHTQVGASAIDALLNEWNADPMRDEEEHWQSLFAKYSFVLDHLFYTPTVVIQDKAYVGGKRVDGNGGSVADYLAKNMATGRAVIVEIKKPTTLLLGQKYRNNIWNISAELSGGVLQALGYRDMLHEEMRQLGTGEELLHRSLPICALIAGMTSELQDEEQRRSFELARQRTDIVVVTFDELRRRLELMRDAFRPQADPGEIEAAGPDEGTTTAT